MDAPQPGRIDIGAALQAGWQRLWPNIVPMGLFAVLVLVLNLLLQGLQSPDAGLGVQLLFGIVAMVVGQLVAIGWIKIALDITDGRPVSADAVTDRFRLVGPYLVAAIAVAVMVTLGLVLLIVPGVIAAIVFMFYGFHIVDTGSRDPFGALSRSAQLTRGHRMQLFLLALVLFAVNVLGLLLLIVGVIITSAISLLAVADVYRQLAPAGQVDTAPDAAY